MKKITREKIEIRGHGSLRIKGRQHFNDEQIKDLISEKHYNKVIKNEDGEFELTYNNPINGKKVLNCNRESQQRSQKIYKSCKYIYRIERVNP